MELNGKLSQPYSQYSARVRPYVLSRLSLVYIHFPNSLYLNSTLFSLLFKGGQKRPSFCFGMQLHLTKSNLQPKIGLAWLVPWLREPALASDHLTKPIPLIYMSYLVLNNCVLSSHCLSSGFSYISDYVRGFEKVQSYC